MATYYLSAELDGTIHTVSLDATCDGDAIVAGSLRVMSLAYPNVALWAKGEITLTDSEGLVIHTMSAK